MNTGAVAAFEKAVERLKDRLKDPLIPAQPGAREIKSYLKFLASLLASGSWEEARWQLLRIESFITDWDDVGGAMPEYIRELRRRVIADDQRGGYAGCRAELALAAFFVRKGISLIRRHGEGADFELLRTEGKIILESTSIHLLNATEANFHKVENAIHQKGQRGYCGADALLHVDYTGVLRHGGDAIAPAFPDRVKAVVRATRWGAVILSAFLVPNGSNQFQRVFLRFDGLSQTAALQAVLAAVMPHGEHYVGRVAVPPIS